MYWLNDAGRNKNEGIFLSAFAGQSSFAFFGLMSRSLSAPKLGLKAHAESISRI